MFAPTFLPVVDLADFCRRRALRKSLFVLSRLCMHPRDNFEWLRFIRDRLGRNTGPLPVDLVEKPVRAYVHHGLTYRERMALLRGHYSIAERQLPASLLQAVWAGETSLVGELAGRDLSVRVLLHRAMEARQEGELAITVEDGRDGLRLARIAFVLAGDPEHPDLVIGGLQGLPSGHDKKRIVEATRRMSGLRPKALALAALQSLGRNLGSTEILAVSRANHTAAEKTAAHRALFHADYDSFWRERGGVEDERYGFRLPVHPGAVAATAPERRRQAYVDQLDALWSALLNRAGVVIPFTPASDQCAKFEDDGSLDRLAS